MTTNEIKFDEYLRANGYVLEFAAIEAMQASNGEDEYFMGKAEGLCIALAQVSGVNLDWVRDHICEKAF